MVLCITFGLRKGKEMLIKVEEVEENGVPMYKEYYGPDKNHITATILGGGPQDQEEIKKKIEESNEEVGREITSNDIMAEILLNQAVIMNKLNEMGGNS